jgi:hypothetical protein
MRAAIRWFAIPLLGGSLPAVAQPAPVIDNERVTVWDIKLTKGEAGPATPNDQDTVIMFLEGGDIRTLSLPDTGVPRVNRRDLRETPSPLRFLASRPSRTRSGRRFG